VTPADRVDALVDVCRYCQAAHVAGRLCRWALWLRRGR
jgi:hypothetical protein